MSLARCGRSLQNGWNVAAWRQCRSALPDPLCQNILGRANGTRYGFTLVLVDLGLALTSMIGSADCSFCGSKKEAAGSRAAGGDLLPHEQPFSEWVASVLLGFSRRFFQIARQRQFAALRVVPGLRKEKAARDEPSG
jgi:hypothetical protein